MENNKIKEVNIQDINERKNENDVSNIPNKNLTLQYYKILFYSTKAELKLYEFFSIVSWVNHLELFLFVVGIVLFIIAKTKSAFAIINITHAIKSLIGYRIIKVVPCSHELIDKMEISVNELENDSFTDIMKRQVKLHFYDKIKTSSGIITIFFILAFINFFIDLVDFINSLSNLSKGKENLEKEIYEQKADRFNAYTRLLLSGSYLSNILIKCVIYPIYYG